MSALVTKGNTAMFHFLPRPVRTAIGIIGIVLNTIFWTTPLFILTAIKLLTPSVEGRTRLAAISAGFA